MKNEMVEVLRERLIGLDLMMSFDENGGCQIGRNYNPPHYAEDCRYISEVFDDIEKAIAFIDGYEVGLLAGTMRPRNSYVKKVR